MHLREGAWHVMGELKRSTLFCFVWGPPSPPSKPPTGLSQVPQSWGTHGREGRVASWCFFGGSGTGMDLLCPHIKTTTPLSPRNPGSIHRTRSWLLFLLLPSVPPHPFSFVAALRARPFAGHLRELGTMDRTFFTHNKGSERPILSLRSLSMS